MTSVSWTQTVALALSAAALVGGASQASAATHVVQGSSFSLPWTDAAIAATPVAGFSDSDLFVGFDSAVLQLTGVTPGDVFPGATATFQGTALAPAWAPTYTFEWYTVTGGDTFQYTSAGDVVHLSLSVLAGAPLGSTFVYLLPFSYPDTFAAPYYNVDPAGMEFNITAVPEPDTVAMLLAGLGLVGAAVGRRRSTRGRSRVLVPWWCRHGSAARQSRNLPLGSVEGEAG